MEKKLKNSVAVITGAAGTLCSEMARNLASQGAKVALLDRSMENLRVVESEIRNNHGEAVPITADVTDEQAMLEALAITLKELGKPSILINGAGGNQMEAITTVNEFVPQELEGQGDLRGFFNLSMDKYHEVLKINTMGTVIPCHVFGKEMAKSGGGSIVNIASMNSLRPLSRVGAYSMAKAGIVNFTAWLAAYLAPAKIRVNAIAPGFFLNERSRARLTTPEGGFTDRGQSIVDHTPFRRFGEAPELIGTMNWFIDDDASGFVTGVTVPVDGGFLSSSGI